MTEDREGRSQEDQSEDRRREPRLTINKAFASYDAFVEQYVTDVSETGVFVRSDNPLPLGSEVNLCFTIIMDDVERIEGTGRVVRVQEHPHGMGVVFETLTPTSEHLLERLLADRADAI